MPGQETVEEPCCQFAAVTSNGASLPAVDVREQAELQ
jgi:hypothetical protein